MRVRRAAADPRRAHAGTVRVGDAYAIRDGHHRVSVAKARGALSIAAIVA
jgi:hypothetical protein